MTDIAVEITIERPHREVFAYLANFENNPKWQKGMRSARFTSAGAIGVGSTYEQVASFLGKRIETRFEVVGFEPDERVVIESRSGTFPIQVTRSVAPVSEARTVVRARVQGQPTGLFALFGRVIDAMVRRQVRADYRALKRLLEASAIAPGLSA